MFFRRVFNHKKDVYPSTNPPPSHPDANNNLSDNTSEASADVRISSTVDKVRQSHRSQQSDSRMFNVIQLTPLWEHVIRTGHLPDGLSVPDLFDEFSERLNDPEWQVRQHALRVLVDVLIILGPRADAFFAPLVAPLVDNLGHAAPAVRKGALDALRVYIGESRLPENVLCDVIDLGMNGGSDSLYGGRLTVGVMLCLPALIQVTLTHPKRRLLLRAAVNALLSKIGEISYQEIALKILLRIKDIVGEPEFYDYIPVNSQHDFDVLCEVYGLKKQNKKGSFSSATASSDRSSLNSHKDSGIALSVPSSSESSKSWTKISDVAVNRIVQGSNRPATVTVLSNVRESLGKDEDDTEIRWKINKSSEEGNPNATSRSGTPCSQRNDSYSPSLIDSSNCPLTHVPESELPPGKVIMETEIQLNEVTAVTMRILEADCSNDQEIVSEEETIVAAIESSSSTTFTDTADSMKTSQATTFDGFEDNLDQNRRSTPKRVHFGGEIIKIRTPDSESVAQSDVDDHIRPVTHPVFPQSPLRAASAKRDTSSSSSPAKSPTKYAVLDSSSTTSLSIEIPQDNTQPIRDRPKTAFSPAHSRYSSMPSTAPPVINSSSFTPTESPRSNRTKSASPYRQRRLSLGSRMDAIGIITPTGPHTPMEMLYNLQRSPLVSPIKGSITPFGDKEDMNHHLERKLNDSVTAVQVDEGTRRGDSGNSGDDQQKNQLLSWQDLEIIHRNTAKNLKSPDWTLRSSAYCQLEKALMSTDNFASVQPCLDSLLRTLLSSEKHCEVADDKKRILINMISRLPLETVENRSNQILVGICRQGGPNSNQIARAMMQRMPAAAVVGKLLSEEFLHARSSRFRENALQIVLYSLMTFPSTYFDVSNCVARTVHVALDTKKRVRQAALDVLAVLGQISSPKIVVDVTQQVAANRVDGDKLCAAVKARLSRKQLPVIRSDDSVQYGLRLPNSHNFSVFGADIEWISNGIGSVSPKSLKARGSFKQNNPPSYVGGGGSSSTTTTESELDSPNGAKSFIPSVHSTAEREFKFGNRGNQDQPTPSRGFHSSASFPDLNGHGGAITAIGFNNNNRDGGGGGNKDNKRTRFVNDDEDSEDDKLDKQEMLVVSAIPLHMRGGVGGTGAGRDTKEENTWKKQQAKGQSFPELNANPHQHSMSDDSFKDAGQQRRSAKVKNDSNCGGGGTGGGSGEGMHDNKSNISRLLSMETCSFGERICGDQGFEIVDDGSDDEEDNDDDEDVEQSCGQRFTSARRNNERDRVGSQETLCRQNTRRGSRSPPQQLDPFGSKSAHTNDHISSSDNYDRKPKGILVSKSADTKRNIPTSTPDINFKNNDGGHAEDDQVDELPPEKVSTPMAAAMKSAYSYKRSLHHLGKQSSSSSNNSDDVAFGVVSEPQRSSRTDQEQEVASELSTSSSNSSQNGKRGQASAASIANRLNKLQDYNESDIKGLSRTLSVQTLPMINSPPDRHEQQFAEGRPKTSIGLNGSIPFDEIPIKTRYSSTLSLGQTAQTSPHAYDEVDKQISPFDTNFSQSIAANLNKPEPLRPLQRNATEFIKSPKSFLRRNNRKIFPTKITTSMSQSLTKHAHSPTKIPKMKAYSPPSAAGLSNFERPKEAYATCMSQLEDSNWETVMLGLKNFLRLIRNHPEYIDPHIHVMAGILAKHVRNLRSQVSRAACQATESFFLTHHKQLETEADDLVSTLLLRTADTNKFLRKDATKALESMCDNLTTQKVIHLLSTRGVTHQNALVKTTTSYLLCRVVVNLGAEKVYSLRDDSRDRVFITAATLLTEGSLETRNYAKQVFRILSSHLKYQKVLLEVIPTKLYRHIEKSLKKVEK